jgi:hypothetical protein
MGEMRNECDVSVGRLNKGQYLKDLSVDGMILLVSNKLCVRK